MGHIRPPPPCKSLHKKKFILFYFILFYFSHFRCILLQISHKIFFFISISILGRSVVNSVCTSWNKDVRRILNIPHDAHTWLLGPLMKQNHIKKQFIVRTLRFLFCILKSHNGIIQVCTLNALSNANSLMGSNLSFFCVLNMEFISNHIV